MRYTARTITAALALGALTHLWAAPPASAQAGSERRGGPAIMPPPAPPPAPPMNNNGGGNAPVIRAEPPRVYNPEPPRQPFYPSPQPSQPFYPSPQPSQPFYPSPQPFYPSPVINTPSPVMPNAPGQGYYQNTGPVNSGPVPPSYPTRTYNSINNNNTNNSGERPFSGGPNAPYFPAGPGHRSSGYPDRSGRPARPFDPGIQQTISVVPSPAFPVTTPQGQQYLPGGYYGGNYLYSGGGTVVVTNGPALLGGYYYSNYCDQYYGANTYPSLYGAYGGFPAYIYNPSVIVLDSPPVPVYYTPYLPFYAPTYPVTYNENNYYVTTPERADQIQQGGEPARQALTKAYAADSFQAAFADIALSWTDGSIAPLQKHVRDSDTKISVSLGKKYSYSIATGDYLQITRDALDRLQTVSFEFTRVRKAKNGDITAFGKHVYRTTDAGASDSKSGAATSNDGTVPFDQADTAKPYDKSGDPAQGGEKTVYVSYTLRRHDDQWYIVAVDSSPTNLVN